MDGKFHLKLNDCKRLIMKNIIPEKDERNFKKRVK